MVRKLWSGCAGIGPFQRHPGPATEDITNRENFSAARTAAYSSARLTIASMQKIRLAILLSGLALTPIFASDHIDGPITTKHKVGDLTDLFAFPTPNASGSLTL